MVSRPWTQAERSRGLNVGTIFILLAPLSMALYFCYALAYPDLMGWPIAPISLCFALSISAFISETRSISDLLSVKSIFYLFFSYFGGIAPLLHIQFNFFLYLNWYSGQYEWVGIWSTIQLIGLASIIILSKIYRTPNYPIKIRNINEQTLLISIIIIFFGSLLIRLYQISTWGGIGGLMSQYSDALSSDSNATEIYSGAGVLTMFGDAAQNLLPIIIILLFKRFKITPSIYTLLFYFIICFMFASVLGGLRGSRGNVILSLFISFWSYHAFYSRISWRFVAIGLAAFIGFMTISSWYKFGGIEGVFNPAARERAMAARQITDDGAFILLRDFSRADIQSYALMKAANGEIDYSFGRSYLGAATFLIPKAIIPFKPATFVKEKTELRYGKGTYSSDFYYRLVFGQFAEFLLNFGFLGVPMFFGFMHVFLKRLSFDYMANMDINFFKLCGPFLSFSPLFILTTDSNVIVMMCAKYLLPILLTYGLYSMLKFLFSKPTRPHAISS